MIISKMEKENVECRMQRKPTFRLALWENYNYDVLAQTSSLLGSPQNVSYLLTYFILKISLRHEGSVAEWSACQTHNPVVSGSRSRSV